MARILNKFYPIVYYCSLINSRKWGTQYLYNTNKWRYFRWRGITPFIITTTIMTFFTACTPNVKTEAKTVPLFNTNWFLDETQSGASNRQRNSRHAWFSRDMLRRMQIASVITVSAPPSARRLPFCTSSNYAGLQQRNYPLCLTFTLTWPDGLHNFIEGTLDKAMLYEIEILRKR